MRDVGQGVIQDYKLSHMWLNIAATSGEEYSAENRDRVAENMPAAQIESAQDMARDWVAKHPG